MSNKYEVHIRDTAAAVSVRAERFDIEDGNYVFRNGNEKIAAFNCLSVRFVARRLEEAEK